MRDLVDELLHAKVKAQLFGGDHAPRLGRLIILERIGSGAMGDVFSAHDPRLDRKVAVKIVRPTAAVPTDRVLAEARALAKLAHPNVVTIHDAEYLDAFDAPDKPSMADDAIAIVMELAPGISLRTWLATDRDWRDIARVLREAASGLAAAHAAGLVHRDVKPDNILVGDDRTRVVDFGLAFASSTSDDEARSGAGTPTYMAPEVLGGAAATPEADQFSFGVTMFEALYGVRPHSGTSREELRLGALSAASAKPSVVVDRVTGAAGKALEETTSSSDAHDGVDTLAAPSAVDALGKTAASSTTHTPRSERHHPTIAARSSAPPWLHAIAVRALAGNPQQRFASMAEVAAELGRDRRRKRWFAVAVGAVVLAAGAGAFVAYRAKTDVIDPCGGADARVASVWSPVRSNGVRARLGDAHWVPATIAALDARSAAWATSYRHVCEATRVRGAQSDTLLDLRMRCLDRALERFDALAIELASPLDAKTRVEATSAIAELPAAEACETLVDAGELALPADLAGRERALAARRDVARAWAAFSLSKYRDAQTIGTRVERDIAGLDAPSVSAEVAVIRAAVEARIGTAEVAKPALDNALVAASRANAPELETNVWAMRLRYELFAGHPERIEELLPLARAAAARAHRDGAELDGIAGEAMRDAFRLEEARKFLERAWASKDPLRADQRAVIAMNLGAVHLLTGDLGRAEGAFVRAHELAESVLGAGHPSLALYLDKLAAVDRARGRMREALARNNASLEVRVAAYGTDDRAVATSLLGRARTYLEMGDVAAAKADATRAHEIRKAVFDTSARLGETEALLGDIALATGDRIAALSHFDAARGFDERVPLTLRYWSVNRADEIRASGFPTGSRVQAVTATMGTYLVFFQMLARGHAAGFVKDSMAMLVDHWRRMPRPLDPSVTFVLGITVELMDKKLAAEMFTEGLAQLADQPSRTRLRFLRRLAMQDIAYRDEERRVRDAMPQLGGDLDLPGPD